MQTHARQDFDRAIRQDSWAVFASVSTSEDFCRTWIDIQCRMIPGARAALLLLELDDGSFGPAAVWPHGTATRVEHLAEIARQSLTEQRGLVLPSPISSEGDPTILQAAWPIDVGGKLYGTIVVEAEGQHDTAAEDILHILQWGAGWLEVLFRRQTTAQDSRQLARASIALEILVSLCEHERLRPAALALASACVEKLGCRSAMVGVNRGRHTRLIAVSDVSWFRKTSEVTAAVENAMGEAIDQYDAVAFPQELSLRADAIIVAQRQLAELARSGVVVSAPLTVRGEAIGALTLEWEQGTVPPDDSALIVATTAALAGPVIGDKMQADRLVAGRISRGLSSAGAALVDPRRPGTKLLAAALLAAFAYFILAEGDRRVTSDAVIEGVVQRAAVAPFDGYIDSAEVRPGDRVEAGQELVRFDDTDLVLEELRWASELAQHQREYRDALAQHDRAAIAVLAAQIDQAEAQLDIARLQLSRTVLRAPFDGTVVAGDLDQRLGSPVQTGEILYEIAPLDAYRVAISVDEREITAVSPGDPGQLSLAAMPGTQLDIEVQTVTPVAEAAEGRTRYRVEASLAEDDPRLRPGLEGIAKVVVGQERKIVSWTRPIVDWLRLQLWTWMP